MIGSLLLVTLWSTVLAFVIYDRVMERASATTMSIVTYLNPVVAAILGVVVLNERLGWNDFLGGGLILLSAALVNGLGTSIAWDRFGQVWRRRLPVRRLPS